MICVDIHNVKYYKYGDPSFTIKTYVIPKYKNCGVKY